MTNKLIKQHGKNNTQNIFFTEGDMLAYFKVYWDLEYTGFPSSSYSKLEKIYIYEPIPDINMSIQELCDWLNEKKERTNTKVVLDKYYYGILLANFYMYPFEPGYIYGFISFVNPIKNATIRGIWTKSLKMFDHNVIKTEIDSQNKDFLVKLDDFIEYDHTILRDLNYSKWYILSKQFNAGGSEGYLKLNYQYDFSKPGENWYYNTIATNKWNLLELNDITISNITIEPLSIYKGYPIIPTNLIDKSTWEVSDETTRVDLVSSSIENPQNKVFLGIDPRKLSEFNRWLRSFWLNKIYTPPSYIIIEEQETAEFQWLSGVNGVLLDHFIVKADFTTNDISFTSLLSDDDYTHIPIDLLASDLYATDRTYSERHFTSPIALDEEAMKRLPTYFYDMGEQQNEKNHHYLWETNHVLDNWFSKERSIEDYTDTADWMVNQNNAVQSLDVTTFNWFQKVHSRFRPFWSDSWAVGDISSAQPHFQVFYNLRWMDQTSLDLLNSINWNPRDVQWWVENIHILPQIKFHQRWFMWEIDGTDMNIVNKNIHTFDDLHPVQIIDNSSMVLRDWNIVFNANDSTQNYVLVEKTWEWNHSWEFETTDSTFASKPKQTLLLNLNFYDDNTTHLFDATHLVSDVTFSFGFGDSSNLDSTFYENLITQKLYEQDSSVFFAWQFLSSMYLNFDEPFSVNEIYSNDNSTFIFPVSVPHMDLTQINFPDTTMDHPTLGLILYNLHGIEFKTEVEQFLLCINLMHPITSGYVSNQNGTQISHNKQPWVIQFNNLDRPVYNGRRYDMLYQKSLTTNKPTSRDVTYINWDMTDINDPQPKPVVDQTFDKWLIVPYSDGKYDALAVYEDYPSDVTNYYSMSLYEASQGWRFSIIVLYSTEDSSVALSNSGFVDDAYKKVTISKINNPNQKIRFVAPNMQIVRDPGKQEYYVDPTRTIGKITFFENTQILCDDIHDYFNEIGVSPVFISDGTTFDIPTPNYAFGKKFTDFTGKLYNIDQTTQVIKELSGKSIANKLFNQSSLDSTSLWKLEAITAPMNNLAIRMYHRQFAWASQQDAFNYPQQHLRQANAFVGMLSDSHVYLSQYPMNRNYIVRGNGVRNPLIYPNTGEKNPSAYYYDYDYYYSLPMTFAYYDKIEDTLTTKSNNTMESWISWILLLYGKRIVKFNEKYTDKTSYVIYENGSIGSPLQKVDVTTNIPIKQHDSSISYPMILSTDNFDTSTTIYQSKNIIHGAPFIDLTAVLSNINYGESFSANQYNGSLFINENVLRFDATYEQLLTPTNIVGLSSGNYIFAALWSNVTSTQNAHTPNYFLQIMHQNTISGAYTLQDVAHPKTELLSHENPSVDMLENSNTGYFSKQYAMFRLNAQSSDRLLTSEYFDDLNYWVYDIGYWGSDIETYNNNEIIEKATTLPPGKCMLIQKDLPNILFDDENDLDVQYYGVIDSSGNVYCATTNNYGDAYQASTIDLNEFIARGVQDNIDRNDPNLDSDDDQRMKWFYSIVDETEEYVQNFINIVKNQNIPPKTGNLYMILPYSEYLSKKMIKYLIE